jgi:signal transduction histidine kinase
MGVLVGWVAIFILGALTTYHNTVRVVVPYALFSLVLTWIPWIVSWRKSFAPSRFFVIAWLGMLISLFLILVVRLRILPSMPLTEQLYQPGILIMAIGWSMAMADRINFLKAETEQANQQMRSTERELTQILDGVPVGVAVYGKDEMPRYANKRVNEILGNPDRGIQPDPKSGTTLAQALDYFSFHIAGTDEWYPREHLPVYRALQGHTSSVDDLEADLVDRQVPIEMWASPILDETGNITSAVTALLDISRRKQTDAELDEYRKLLETLVEKRTADLSAINNWLNTITEIHHTLGGAKDLPEAYKKMSAAIAQLLEARAVFVVHWDEPFEHCEVHYDSREEFPVSGMLINQLKTSVVRDRVFYKGGSTGKPILLTADQRLVFSMVFADRLSQEEIQLFVLVPMITHQNVSGLLGIVFRDPKMEISQQQMLLMGKMALDVANLTQNAFLLDQSIELATLEERQRIARDLHDSVTQMIYSASMFSSTLPNRIHRDPESAVEIADELHRLTRGALAEMRTLLLELRPTGIIRMPLSELLTQLAQATAGRSDFSLDLDVEDIPILPDGVQVVFYRIAQEALNNILKHANAKQAVLRLNTNPSLGSQAVEDWHGEITLTIEDDGVGFDPELINYEHFGLGIMQERVDSIQAQFHLDSRPGGGTEVMLIWQR